MTNVSFSLTLVGLYVLFLITIAFWVSRKSSSTSTDYYLANREVGWLAFALTLFATWMSTFAFLGSPGFYYLRGVNWQMPHGYLVVASPFFLWFIGRRIWVLGTRHNFLTPGDLFAHVFNSSTARLLAAVICLVALVPYCLIQLVGIGKVIAATTDGQVSYELAVSITAISILIYSIVGGVRAVIWTDAIQAVIFGVILVGGAASIVWSLADTDGLAKAISNVDPNATSFNPETLGIPITLLVMWGFGYILSPHMWQRLYMTKSAENLSHGMLVGTVAALLLIALPSLVIGMLANGSGISVSDSDTLMVAVFEQHANWLLPILLVGAVSAGMSTVDSQLLTASSIISHDILGFRNASTSSWVGRITVMGGIALFIFLALSPLKDGAIVLLASKGIGITLMLLIPLLYGLFSQKRNSGVGVAMLIAGPVILAVFEFGLVSFSIPFGFGAPVAAVVMQSLLWLLMGSLGGHESNINHSKAT